jgi:hypothetical protein
MMTEFIDKLIFQELAARDPIDVCRRAACSYDDTNKFYRVSVWGEAYKIYPHQFRIEHLNEDQATYQPYLDIFAVHYLLKAKEIAPVNQWISEKDIPGGSTFFRGPHEIPTHFITAQFNNDIEGFKSRCERLVGSPLRLADAAFAFEITPRIPVAVLYWTGDDEFPAESKILYDRTIAEQLASDIIYGLAVGICEKIGKSMG